MLAAIQSDLRAALLDGARLPAAARHVTANGIDAAARLRIYRNHLLISLTEALQTTFPTVAKLVGEGFFVRLAHGFIAAHPPQRPCLSEYGGAFPAFVAGFEAAGALPYLADVARFDWAINVAFNAPDAPPFDVTEVQALPADRLARSGFALHPSFQLVESRFPIDEIWRANAREEFADNPIDLNSGPVALAVWRDPDDVAWRRLAAGEAAFVGALTRGLALGTAAEAAAAAESRFGLETALARLIATGSIIGLLDAAGT